MEQWSVVFQTVENLFSMVGAIATLVLLMKRDQNHPDDRDRRG
jgi:hypothetical protein